MPCHFCENYDDLLADSLTLENRIWCSEEEKRHLPGSTNDDLYWQGKDEGEMIIVFPQPHYVEMIFGLNSKLAKASQVLSDN
jgi:hypothetical protein